MLLIFLVLCSCKKEEAPKEKKWYDYYDGQLTLKRNGKEKKFKLLALTNDTIFWINIADVRDDFAWDEAEAASIPLQEGTYILEDYRAWKFGPDTFASSVSTAYYNGSFNQGSDVATPNYLRKDRPRFITLSTYDPVNKTVSGTFSMSFKRDSSSQKDNRLDTVSYTDAVFSATLHHRDELPQ
ncbi:MAG: hypothetical protein JNL13_08165 [Chitinophagaceae bacterium]|nr:hypothetical protein [Chitinophagaceae bacterium]